MAVASFVDLSWKSHVTVSLSKVTFSHNLKGYIDALQVF